MTTADSIRDTCFIIYKYFWGKNVARIEREMRGLGHAKFHRRILYSRTERGEHKPGWIEKYDWKACFSSPDGVSTSHRVSSPHVSKGSSQVPDPAEQTETCPQMDTDKHRWDEHPPNNICVHPCSSVDENPAHAISSATTSGGKPTFPSATDELSPPPPPPIPGNDATKNPHSEIPNPQSNDFHSWLKRVSPNMTWDWKHQKLIIDQLEKVTNGDCKRLMIFLPPRHGKSELVTVRYSAWRMLQKPETSMIVGAYGQRLADRFSRKIRKVIIDDVQQSRLAVGGKQLADTNERSVNRCSSDADKTSPTTSTPPHTAFRQPPSAEPSMFPFASQRSINRVSEWETAAGGGFRSVGVGGAVTGFGAQLIVIDDPVKNRAQAESLTYRDRVWQWYNDDLSTRLEPDGSIILIQTRWHEDDLAGRLLRESNDGGEEWTIINLPALSEPPAVAGGLTQPIDEFKQDAQDVQDVTVKGGNATVRERGDEVVAKNEEETTKPHEPARIESTTDSQEGGLAPALPSATVSGGKPTFLTATCDLDSASLPTADRQPPSADWRTTPGIALCPERFDEVALEKTRRKLGTYSFSALYQQRPAPADGGKFKREWFKRIISHAPDGLRWKRGYDLAVSTKTTADYTASFLCAFDKHGNLYIADGFRKRIEYPEQRRYVLERLKAEPNAVHGIEDALHGKALIQDLRRDAGARGHALINVKVDTDKETRAMAWSPLAEEGKVILIRGPWIHDFIEEACTFPVGQHDDQIDAVSLAVQMLRKTATGQAWGF